MCAKLLVSNAHPRRAHGQAAHPSRVRLGAGPLSPGRPPRRARRQARPYTRRGPNAHPRRPYGLATAQPEATAAPADKPDALLPLAAERALYAVAINKGAAYLFMRLPVKLSNNMQPQAPVGTVKDSVSQLKIVPNLSHHIPSP